MKIAGIKKIPSGKITPEVILVTARDNKQKMTENCPEKEMEIQDSCSPCGATACDTGENAACDPCE